MTRKHFNAIAAALKDSRPTISTPETPGCASLSQWTADVHAMADTCRSFNGMFDRNRFLSACGV